MSSNPLGNTYATKDGRFLSLMLLQPDRHWPDLARAIERPDLLEDPRFATGAAIFEHAVEMVDILEPLFASRTLAEWRDAFSGARFPWAPFARIPEVIEDPQVAGQRLHRRGRARRRQLPLPDRRGAVRRAADRAAPRARARRAHRAGAARARVSTGTTSSSSRTTASSRDANDPEDRNDRLPPDLVGLPRHHARRGVAGVPRPRVPRPRAADRAHRRGRLPRLRGAAHADHDPRQPGGEEARGVQAQRAQARGPALGRVGPGRAGRRTWTPTASTPRCSTSAGR